MNIDAPRKELWAEFDHPQIINGMTSGRRHIKSSNEMKQSRENGDNEPFGVVRWWSGQGFISSETVDKAEPGQQPGHSEDARASRATDAQYPRESPVSTG